MEANRKSSGRPNKRSAHTTDESTVNDREAQSIAAELTLFQIHSLRAIAKVAQEDRRQHGLSVKSELETYYREEVNHGRLYPNLDELVEAGLVEKSELDKRTNEYLLTQRGYDVLEHVYDTIGDVVAPAPNDGHEEDGAEVTDADRA